MTRFCTLLVILLSFIGPAHSEVLNIDGSDSLAPFIRLNLPDWIASNGGHPISVSANGSSTGIRKLISGEVMIAPASREMTKEEYEQYFKQQQHLPFFIKVAIDGIRIIVHHNNPIEGIKLTQLGQLYSSTGGCKSETSIRNWSQMSDGYSGKVVPMSRGKQSGTFGLINMRILCGEPLLSSVMIHPDHHSTIKAVAKNPNAIGYISMNVQSDVVKTLPIWSVVAKRYVYLDEATITYGYYPLARHLMVYAALDETGKLPKQVKSLLEIMLSESGQAKADMLGYTRLSKLTLEKQIEKLKMH